MVEHAISGGAPSSGAALITGGGSGIGRQLALDLAAEGWAVGLIDQNAEGLAEAAGQLAGHRCAWAAADVTDSAQLSRAVAEIEGKVGATDLLIACAGIGIETSALAISAADIERVIRVNLIGVSNSVAAVLPGMLARRRGHIVGLSSLASYRGMPRMIGYCASKAGVNALLESIRVEVQPLGVHVTTICPGWIRTPMTDPFDVPERQKMEVADASRHIRDAIRRRRPFLAFPAGDARRLALLRWLPPGLSDRLLRRVAGPIPERKQ